MNSGSMKQDNIFCKIDMSQEIRNKECTLREKISRLKKDGDDLKFRVRSLRIEKQSPSGEWVPVKTAQENKETEI